MKNVYPYLVAVLLAAAPAGAQENVRLVDISGEWKFEAGDDMRWASPEFNDRSWETIRAPGPWEDQGYPGYDGYAWYRKHIRVPETVRGKMLLLRVGVIDDVDEVYVNGRFVGFMGIFPPAYRTAYNLQREYQLPSWMLKPGEDNVIAVRVYDDQLNGGIVQGDLGLYEVKNPPYPNLSLDGMWKLRMGDDPAWCETSCDDAQWDSAYVPAYWETQGHKGYDGPGWYRLHVTVPEELADQRLLLLMGRIDDFDETYLNGQRIGRTGHFPAKVRDDYSGGEYRQLRAYTIPSGLLHAGSENIIAVRVFDEWLHGGIYRGPVGFITRERYNQWRAAHRESRDFLRHITDYIFD